MKMRISVEDLQQLSPEQQDKLRAWWEPEVGDWVIITGETLGQGKTALVTNWHPEHDLANLVFIGESGFCSYTRENLTPLFSVSQCLERLAQESEIDLWDKGAQIEITFLRPREPNEVFVSALWQAVKSIL